MSWAFAASTPDRISVLEVDREVGAVRHGRGIVRRVRLDVGAARNGNAPHALAEGQGVFQHAFENQVEFVIKNAFPSF